jgi:hypothetical protein
VIGVHWFGEPWPSAELRAAVCEDDTLRVPPPLPGELCVLCDEGFQSGAQGVRMPHITADGFTERRYCHLKCLLGNVGAE